MKGIYIPKETGIIMSSDHPRLILAGLKTQIRRVIKPQPIAYQGVTVNRQEATFYKWNTEKPDCESGISENIMKHRLVQYCPYGQVGDRLWVRETWQYSSLYTVVYKADGDTRYIWRPSIHLHKKDARIWLEITGLRAERLRNASLADAIAEGFKTVEELISAVLRLNHLPEDADPWLWVISFKLLTERA